MSGIYFTFPTNYENLFFFFRVCKINAIWFDPKLMSLSASFKLKEKFFTIIFVLFRQNLDTILSYNILFQRSIIWRIVKELDWNKILCSWLNIFPCNDFYLFILSQGYILGNYIHVFYTFPLPEFGKDIIRFEWWLRGKK